MADPHSKGKFGLTRPHDNPIPFPYSTGTLAGECDVKVREGLIPTALGTLVTAAGLALRNLNRVRPADLWGVTGFELAHIVLGAIDLVEHRR